MIPRIKKILYATDLSKNANYAFGHAINLAHHHDAKITVMHVLEELSPFAYSMVEDIAGAEKLEALKNEKQAYAIESVKKDLHDFCEQVKADAPECPFVVEDIQVVKGNPTESIVNKADAIGADIVILGSHGQGLLADVTLGSVSRRVLRRCTRPVLIVRLPE